MLRAKINSTEKYSKWKHVNLTVANANQWKGKILEVHCSKNVTKFKQKNNFLHRS